MTMGDVEPTTEQLPLVGCEAEVTTEKESISETLTHECSSKTGMLVSRQICMLSFLKVCKIRFDFFQMNPIFLV